MGLAVASVSEAARLRRAGIEGAILVLSAGDPRQAREVVKLRLVQTACRAEVLRALSQAAERLGECARVHVKIDTGMGRLGVSPEEAAAFAGLALSLPGVSLDGVFSHLATAESSDPAYAHLQFDRFRRALDDMSAAGIDPGRRHLANSAAALRFPEMRLDAIRTGLLIYGILPDAPELERLDVRPALTWKTRVAFVHRLPPGSAVSYGGTFVTKGECLAGVLPLGYADGYPRRASNRGHVLVRGKPCPVIGVVCMDHVMVDLGPAGNARVGDEVVLIGQQENAEITANHVAQWADTVVHEVPTMIGSRVSRLYVDQTEPVGPEPGPER
jgi:alanine racemase